METSLRLGGDSKALRIHAKEKFPIDSGVHLQAHGEIDTSTGAPSYLALIVRNSYPEMKQRGAVEFAWSIFNFKKDQDVRIKLGYEVFDKSRNSWLLSASISQGSFSSFFLHFDFCNLSKNVNNVWVKKYSNGLQNLLSEHL
ncbi:outer envelope pore protein 21B, chloroplastic isoform X3 [Phoenix dactylifera]|uniref:Outer envelope pore protein 21B, chloroplastic isoform X3 n=1 Tax=Phoenix dactylifera TaxID=42345 RepID=A0A8B8ZHS6_PHODC|nr:outer envelope pore protein 21B, chloroplastic isoform X3 [Phoenix dactylifera]